MVARLFAATVAAGLGLVVSASAQCPGGCATGGCGSHMYAAAPAYGAPMVAGCNTCGTGGQMVAMTSSGRRGMFARRSGTTMTVAQPTMLASTPMMMTTQPMMVPMPTPMPASMPAAVTGTGVVQTAGTATQGAVVPATTPMPMPTTTTTTTTTTPTTGTVMVSPQPMGAYVMSMDSTGYYTPTTVSASTTTQRRGLFGRIFRR